MKGKFNICKLFPILSRLSKVKDSLLTFDEVVDFLQPFIQGRTDESSNENPKWTFDLNIIRRVLTEVELDALLAISAKISVKTVAVWTALYAASTMIAGASAG